ncbi:MAG TPA: SDR family NAD(P)-dependent oxidoreductase [Thermoanaerobaculia bacterium]|jgi:short-subunit dehydrogenase
MTRVAILGATSAIAQEVARLYAAERASLFLVGRDEAKLAAVAADLRVRGAQQVETFLADLALRERDEALAAAAGTPDVVLIAQGTLPEQTSLESDPRTQAAVFDLNATSVMVLAAHFANVLPPGGALCVIGSIAGDRGRRSNYVYGAAKAAIHAYCEGLRARLVPKNVAVVLIKPGWVDTPMTARTKKNALFASPESVGRTIKRAIESRRAVVYVPGYWRWISLVIRMLPARMVKF